MSTRKFSSTMRDTNSVALASSNTSNTGEMKTVHIGFLLLENFSMMSFTAAVDVLITANLVQSHTAFKVSSYALKGSSITSDLGIEIATSGKLSELKKSTSHASAHNKHLDEQGLLTDQQPPAPLDILIVCGGLRCSLSPNFKLTQLLKSVHSQQIMLGSIWNGIIPLAQANLLTDQVCALHIDNHPLIHEHFPSLHLSEKGYVNNPTLISCADALGALDMMLSMIEELNGAGVSRAVKEILSCNRSREGSTDKLIQFGDNEHLPDILRNAIQLMNSNIEEPIAIDELAKYLSANRRQLERLFKQHLNTSPSRHYLEIRLTYARRLLMQSSDSITNIAIACGFVSSNHFSNCFSQYFKMPPSACRKKKNHTDQSNKLN